MKSLVSIIIPTYQHARILPQCLDSVFLQTYPDIEVIVVDDGSTDDTQDVLRLYADRVTIIAQKNSGSNRARNRGFAASYGTYIIFVDADVIMHPEMIARCVAALDDDREASIAYSDFRFGWKRFFTPTWDAERLHRMNYIHTTSLIRRSAFPGFDESIRRFQDWDVWLTMLEQKKRGVKVDGILFHCIIDGVSRIGSSWLPSFVYRLPWHMLPWVPQRIAKYEEARDVILAKHHSDQAASGTFHDSWRK